MARYCITAAKSKNSTHHLNSEFNLWKLEEEGRATSWTPEGWKHGTVVAALIGAGHQVLTGKENESTISTGAALEIEFRTSENAVNYKISEMPED